MDDNLQDDFARLLTSVTGLSFEAKRPGATEKAIWSVTEEFGFEDPAECMDYLSRGVLSVAETDRIARRLTVGETYFFREPSVLDAVSSRVLGPLVERKKGGPRRIRVWSAGCCSGEEPYTLAIMLDRLLPSANEWEIDILGTDINRLFLEKAVRGLYTKWSFRGAPSWLVPEYFRRTGDGLLELDPGIRKMVKFSFLNLARDEFPSLVSGTNAMDLILCRNVLMYFEKDIALGVAERFSRSLVPEGVFVPGLSETGMECFGGFTPDRSPGAVLLRKTGYARQRSAQVLSAKGSPKPENKDAQGRGPSPAPSPSVVRRSEERRPKPEPVCLDDVQALYDSGDYAEALECLNSLSALAKNGAGARCLEIRSMANLGRIAEAEQVCRQALDIHKMNAEMHFLLGSMLQELDDAEGAVRSFRKCLYIDPHYSAARFASGVLLMALGRRQAGQRQLRSLLGYLKDMSEEAPAPGSEGMSVASIKTAVSSLLEERKDDAGS